MFDTHAHLDDEKFDYDREDLISNLKDNGVTTLINPASDMTSSYAAINLANKYDFIYCAVGVHPHETSEMNDDTLIELEKLTKAEKKCVAIGEIGLDYFYDFSKRETQTYWFERQLELAQKIGYPVIIHDRDAHEDCLKIIKKYDVKGVFHCFSGSKEFARELIKLGWFISFTGVITFKNARRAVEAAADTDISRIFIETDSPYMAPEPNRGKRNEPMYVKYVCEKLAQIKGMSTADVEKITSENAKKFFGIK